MKKTFNDILDECSVKEIDVLLSDIKYNLPDEISLDNIQNLTLKKIGVPNKKKFFSGRNRIFIVAAACVTILAAVGLGTAYAVEVKEYSDAVKFFNDNSLSTEGLTRGEVKEVYRDITTESFSSSNTASVLINSRVQGYDILQSTPTSENIQSIWKNKEYAEQEVYYLFDTQYGEEQWVYDSEGYSFGLCETKGSCIDKYVGSELKWCAQFYDFGIAGYTSVDDGIIVYGCSNELMYGEKPSRAWVAFVDNHGKVLWEKEIKSRHHSDTPQYAIDNDNGTYTVFSVADNLMPNGIESYFDETVDNERYMFIRTLNGEGKVIEEYEIPIGKNTHIANGMNLGDGYAAEIYDSDRYGYEDDYRPEVIKINKKGEITNTFTYKADNYEYEFVDMIEFNEKIYISAMCRPEETMYEKIPEGAGPVSMMPYIKDEFTSVLLVCDTDSGIPEEFYSVKGAFACELEIDDGNLLWEVNRILSAYNSPNTNSYWLTGTSCLQRYTFDETSKLVSEKNTGIVTDFKTF